MLLLLLISNYAGNTNFNVEQPGTSCTTSRNNLPNLRILSWNVYMLPYLHYFHNTKARAELIGQALENTNYDIIVFQEAFYTPARKIMYSYLEKNYPFAYGPINSTGVSVYTSSGLFVVSKKPLRLLKSIQYYKSNTFDRLAKKGAALFETSKDGKTFQLIATHLQAEDFPQTRIAQLEQLMLELIMPYSKAGVSQIICGDMNVSSKDRFNYFNMLHTLDAIDSKPKGTPAITYDETNNTLAKKTQPDDRSLDYILIKNRHPLLTQTNKIKVFKGSVNGIKIDLSDHYAIEATIGIRGLLKSN
jgi:endonuclease/exonuclease/phosphatase family metal-dependent hydrolase